MLFTKVILLVMVLLFVSIAGNADVPARENGRGDSGLIVKQSGPVTSNQPVEMATGMRANGKIYVVVAVMSMILIGLIIYLITLDRKIAKLENER
ncbi:MAG: CcmD family protein [Chitinophagaceae bacterium]